jgi:uncharacterized radical SAM protein YgiQ
MSKQSPTFAPPLPMTPAETAARGWDAVDVVFVSGDAYVDHPSFAAALLGRVLEAEGFRVAILSQPDWRSCDAWRSFGRPRVCFAVSAGNLDSMLNHYTAARKVRNDDAYSPDGRRGLRPDRATAVYCQRAREAFHGVPIIAGGIEASLRRLAHYDFWSDRVRRSILLDAKADLLVHGMGERPLVEIVRRLAAGESPRQLRDIRGTAYRLGASEWSVQCPVVSGQKAENPESPNPQIPEFPNPQIPKSLNPFSLIELPSYEAVSTDKAAFVEMTRLIMRETHPDGNTALVQPHDREAVVVNPPAEPLSRAEMDRIYGLPFTRWPHPSYGSRKIPAFEVVKDSIQIVRGCFGGCAFCSIGLHEGRVVQSRGEESVLAEMDRVAARKGFSGTISDLGGPTANMYAMNCTRPDARGKCRRPSCLWPDICPLLATDHGPLIKLLKAARRRPGIKRVLTASGIRMDLALRSPAYVAHVARHHTGGLLKVAPEHCNAETLRRMRKPAIEVFERFARLFRQHSAAAGRRQFLVPYFMAGHPGCDLPAMIELAVYLKRHGLKPEKVQDFIPLPMDPAACMYHTGIDPANGEEVFVPRGDRQRRLQRALLQYFMPENYADVRAALEEAGREDLIGAWPQCLIPSHPPRMGARKKTSSRPPAGEEPATRAPGYRPHRKSARRRK